MKYLNRYDSVVNEFVEVLYWKIPTKEPNLTIALSKIDWCSLETKDFYSNITKKKLFTEKYVYVLYIEIEVMTDYGIIRREEKWEWLETSPDNWGRTRMFDDYKIDSLKNKGTITVSGKEIEQYNLEQVTNKYNL